MSHTDEIIKHPFCAEVLKGSTQIVKEIIEQTEIWNIDSEPKREPTELEFYKIKVGKAIAGIINCLQELEHGVFYLREFTYSKRLKDAGINRGNFIRYCIENYFIRTQILYERCLVLTNAVFHLLLSRRDCKHSAISNNIKVRMTNIPLRLKKIFGHLKIYRSTRNTIIHHENLLDQDLKDLEVLYLLNDNNGEETHLKKGNIDKDIKCYKDNFNWRNGVKFARMRKLKDVVNEKEKEFRAFNLETLALLNDLFTELHPIYNDIEKDLTILEQNHG